MSARRNQRAGKLEGFFHIRNLPQFRRDLKITNGVLFVDDHDSSRENVRITQEQPVSFAELGPPIVGQEGDVVDLGFLSKPFLGEAAGGTGTLSVIVLYFMDENYAVTSVS